MAPPPLLACSLASPSRMTKDPWAVEQQYAQGAREDVVSHGGRER